MKRLLIVLSLLMVTNMWAPSSAIEALMRNFEKDAAEVVGEVKADVEDVFDGAPGPKVKPPLPYKPACLKRKPAVAEKQAHLSAIVKAQRKAAVAMIAEKSKPAVEAKPIVQTVDGVQITITAAGEVNLSRRGLKDLSFLSKLQHKQKIKKLNLSHNEIVELEEDDFKGFYKSLQKLDLSHNKIKRLEGALGLSRGTPAPLVKILDLQRHFDELPGHKQALFVQENGPLGEVTSALQELDLSHNKIDELTPLYFASDTPNVERLNLSFNEIEVVPPLAFAYLDHLQTLNFEGNPLESPDSGDLSESDYLSENLFDVENFMRGQTQLYGLPDSFMQTLVRHHQDGGKDIKRMEERLLKDMQKPMPSSKPVHLRPKKKGPPVAPRRKKKHVRWADKDGGVISQVYFDTPEAQLRDLYERLNSAIDALPILDQEEVVGGDGDEVNLLPEAASNLEKRVFLAKHRTLVLKEMDARGMPLVKRSFDSPFNSEEEKSAHYAQQIKEKMIRQNMSDSVSVSNPIKDIRWGQLTGRQQGELVNLYKNPQLLLLED